jgi:hypothetical protein
MAAQGTGEGGKKARRGSPRGRSSVFSLSCVADDVLTVLVEHLDLRSMFDFACTAKRPAGACHDMLTRPVDPGTWLRYHSARPVTDSAWHDAGQGADEPFVMDGDGKAVEGSNGKTLAMIGRWNVYDNYLPLRPIKLFRNRVVTYQGMCFENVLGVFAPSSCQKEDKYHDFSVSVGDGPAGNTCLVALPAPTLSTCRYLQTARKTVTFETPATQPITRYFSALGNNEVPFPVGLTWCDALFTCDTVRMPRSLFDEHMTRKVREIEQAGRANASRRQEPTFCSEEKSEADFFWEESYSQFYDHFHGIDAHRVGWWSSDAEFDAVYPVGGPQRRLLAFTRDGDHGACPWRADVEEETEEEEEEEDDM